MYFKKLSGVTDTRHCLDVSANLLETLNKMGNEKFDLIFLDLLFPTNFVNINNVQINWKSVQGMTILNSYLEKIFGNLFNKLNSKGILAIPLSVDLLGTVITLTDRIFGTNNRLELFTVINENGTSGTGIINNKSDYILVLSKNKNNIQNLLESPYGKTGDYIYKDRNGKYRLQEISTNDGGFSYELRYSGEKIYPINQKWKYTKEDVENGLDSRYLIRRGHYKRLYLYERDYLRERTRPSNIIELTQNTNTTVIENLYKIPTLNKVTIDIYLYFIRMLDNNSLNILSVNDEDGLLHYVTNWENNQTKSTHTCTVLRNGKNNDLVHSILKDSKQNTVVLVEEFLEEDLPDINLLYELNEGNVLLKNPSEPILKIAMDINTLENILNNPLKYNAYIKTNDKAIINELRKLIQENESEKYPTVPKDIQSTKIYGINQEE